MLEKMSIEEKLRSRLQNDDNNIRDMIMLCSSSTIHWLQRYSHCYSYACSFFCIPLWLILLPVAFILDLFILTITFTVFLISFLIYFFMGPFALFYIYSSCSAAWHPRNIYLYSLSEALRTTMGASFMFNIFWMCYCGTGTIEQGTPICCNYICDIQCHQACGDATGIEIAHSSCTIL